MGFGHKETYMEQTIYKAMKRLIESREKKNPKQHLQENMFAVTDRIAGRQAE